MTIAIDCRMIDASGVGVYLRGCLPWFFQSDNNFLLLGKKSKLQSYVSNNNVTVIPCDTKPFSLGELFFFPLKIKHQLNKADVFYSPFFNIPPVSIPVFTTIHDIIFPDMPYLTSKIGLTVRMFFLRRAYKKSRKIFTVSEFSKSRIKYHLGNHRQIVVSSGGIQPAFLDYRNNRQIEKKETIVFIGNIKKHKGLNCLLDAFIIAKAEGLPHKLIITGERENFRTKDNLILKKINSLGPDTVSFTGFIPDEQLMEILAEASLLVQPSLYEGFGFPPLEAMVLGTQTLVSDIPVFKEIYGCYPVIFFRAGDSLDLKNKMMEILHNKSISNISLPEQLLNKYTFQKTASVILQNLAIPS